MNDRPRFARLGLRLLLAALPVALFLAPDALRAQGCEHTTHTAGQGFVVDGSFYTCGTHYMTEGFDHAAAVERTRLNNPEVYRRMVEVHKNGITLPPQTASDLTYEVVVPFFVNDRDNPGQYTVVEAGLAYTGDSILIWVDVADTSRITEQTINALAEGLEKSGPDQPFSRNPNTGLLYNDLAIFGRPPFDNKFDPDGRFLCSFLLTDIKEPTGLNGGVINGYFSPWDQTDNVGSNEMNLLYVDSKDALRRQSQAEIVGVLGTMAHEFQHLINYNRYVGDGSAASTHWIFNEGLSEVASIRSGYTDRNARNVLSDPNRDPFLERPNSNTDGGTILRAYSRGMLFVHYLSERFGDDFLYELVRVGGVGLEPVANAMAAEGISGDADDVYGDFWAANFNGTSDAVDEIYSYDFSVLGGTMKRTTEVSVPSEQKQIDITFVPHGAYAHRVVNQNSGTEGLQLTMNPGQRDYTTRVIVQSEFGWTTVETMEPGESKFFERFISLGIIVVNLAGDGNNVSFTMAPQAAGVENFASDPGQLELTAISPNPLGGNGAVSFRTAASGPVDLALYDISGREVAQILEDRIYSVGEHRVAFDGTELQPGVYTLRLTDAAGASAVRQIVVVR